MTLICGAPNSGKTTQSQTMSLVYHLSQFYQGNFNQQFIDCTNYLSTLHIDFCIEGVYNTIVLRKTLLNACKNQWYKKCIYREISFNTCLKREKRHRSVTTLKKAYDILEPPTLDEGWDEIIIIHEDNTKTIKKRVN